MLRRKKRCKGCKNYYRPSEDQPPWQNWCSQACQEALALESLAKVRANQLKARQRAEKKQKRQHRKQKRDYKQDKLSHQLELTQTQFNRLVVLLDKDEPCGSCGDAVCGWIWDCGHVKSVGSHPELRFDFLNAYKQGRKCNGGQKRLTSRESTVSKMYEERLVQTQGQAVVDYLNGPHKAKHYTREGLREMRAEFAAEIRYIEKHDRPSKNWREL